MEYIEWTDDFSTGIAVIDGQHKRIVEYINQLTDAQNLKNRTLTGEVLINLTDYTLSHFAFEEALMDEAGYAASNIHKRTHDAFRNKIIAYQEKHNQNEDVSKELYQLLNIWFMNHIVEDDGSYVPVVKENLPMINTAKKQGWIKAKIAEFFN